MAGLSLREAAKETGTSKSTILRAIQSGRLSAARTDDGGYAIDPAELFRVYPVKPGNGADRAEDRSAGQDAPASGPVATELAVRTAQLEAELAAMKSLLDAEKRRSDELREDRDRWHAQAERLALPAPASTRQRGIFGWLKAS